VSVLAERLLEIHDALTAAELPHAFGGAIALAYCTEEPRGTRDLDLNVFAEPGRADEVCDALPAGVARADSQLSDARRDGQVRLWWRDTPIDIFFNVVPFHAEVARTVRQVPFAGRTIPVVSCVGVAVFKALLDRTKDWADIEAMVQAGALDPAAAVGWIAQMIGGDAPAARRMAVLRPV
jgi:hypothetical protein